MRGEDVACSIATLHYVIAIIIIVDSIIFMSGFSPFFITKLAPTVYNILLTYCIIAGSLLHCRPKQKYPTKPVHPIQHAEPIPTPQEVPPIPA